MSYLANLIACPDLQDRLNGYFGCNKATTMAVHETGLTQFLFSPINTNNVLNRTVNPGDGKIRTVGLVYTPRIKADDVSTDINRESCVSTTPYGERTTSYSMDVDKGVEIERKIRQKDLITHCQNNEQYIQEMQMNMMGAAIRKMDVRLSAQVALLKGNFGAGETGVTSQVKTVATRRPTANGGGLSDDFITEIDFAAMNAGYCASPFIFGYTEIYKAYKKLQAQCCADNGTNVGLLAQQVGLNGSFIPESNVPIALGSTADFITLDPGAVQVLTYNGFEGYGNDFDQPTFVQTVIVDPATGIPFDWQAKFDCGYWHFRLSLAFKAVGVPADLYYSGDRYDGATGVNLFKITNPA